MIEDKIPKHVPIKVKLKNEKEKAVKDLNNPNWPRDFALEVTNTSNKPIYFLDLWLELPETLKADGGRDGFDLRFGRADFIEFDTRPEPSDVPIQPGSTYTFEIPEKFQREWERHRLRGNQPHPTKLEITFTQLSFGDGTGFINANGTPYPFTRNEQSLRRRAVEAPHN